jgi:glycyl-tRNA synthetase alpha chain
VENSYYNFEDADVPFLLKLFEMYEHEAERLLKQQRTYPAYGYCLKCSHTFNLLDARGAIGVDERTQYIQRVRALAQGCAKRYLGLDGEQENIVDATHFPILKA